MGMREPFEFMDVVYVLIVVVVTHVLIFVKTHHSVQQNGCFIVIEVVPE